VIAAQERDVFLRFAVNIKALTKCNVRPFIMTSMDFLSKFKYPVKFCHIDASHDYPSVRAEILRLMPLMVPGGVICGDDFQTSNMTCTHLQGGVERAVRESLPGFRSVDNFWYWRKSDSPRSFFRRAATNLPKRFVESPSGRRLIPDWTAPAAYDVLQSMK